MTNYSEKNLPIEAVESPEQENPAQQNESPEKQLEMINRALDLLKNSGVKTEAEIAQELGELESGYTETIGSLKDAIGNDNINEETPGIIHKNTVDDVINFDEYQAERYNALLNKKNELQKSIGLPGAENLEREQLSDAERDDLKAEDEIPAQPEQKTKIVAGMIEDAAFDVSSVGEFESKLGDIKTAVMRNGAFTDEARQLAKEAAGNISAIASGHENYDVEQNLTIDGRRALGVTEGSHVSIEAEHLADVMTDEGKEKLHETLEHENVHTKQSAFTSTEGGTVVIDPKTGKNISAGTLHEGGAEYAMAQKFRGGAGGSLTESESEAATDYREGFDLYKKYGQDTLDQHVTEGGAHAGDAAHLQAELIKKAGVKDIKKIESISKKAGFSRADTKKIISQATKQ